jgi:hypothetical protein
MLDVAAIEPAYTGSGYPEADWWTELYESRGELIPERMPTYDLPNPYMDAGIITTGLGQAGAGGDASSEIMASLGVFLVAGAIALGVGAAYGSIAYGDWKCGFRMCVVPPGWKRGQKISGLARPRWRRRINAERAA